MQTVFAHIQLLFPNNFAFDDCNRFLVCFEWN